MWCEVRETACRSEKKYLLFNVACVLLDCLGFRRVTGYPTVPRYITPLPPLFYSHANICLARLALPVADWATLTPALPNHLHCWCLFLARPVGHFSHIIIRYLKRITQPVHGLCRKCEKMKTAKLTLIGNHCVRFFCMVWNESTEKTASLYLSLIHISEPTRRA